MKKIYTFFVGIFWSALLCSQDRPPILTAEQQHHDLAILKAGFTQLHPGVYRYISPGQLNGYFNDVLSRSKKPQSLNNFYLALSQLAVKLHCGHTYVNPYNQHKQVTRQLLSGQVLPILFKVINRRLIVTHNLSARPGIKAGDELLRINGVQAKSIINTLLTVSRADGRHGSGKQLDNISLSPYFANAQKYALFDTYFPLFFAGKQHAGYYQVLVKPFKGRTIQVRISGMSKQQRQERYQQQYGAAHTPAAGLFSWLTPQCGYLKIKEFTAGGWGKDYRVFLDSVFKALGSRKTGNLVVDIRGNEGGDDDVRNEVIRYLIKQPVYYGIKRYYRFLAVADSLLPYLDTWDPSFKKPKPASDYEPDSTGLYLSKQRSPVDTLMPAARHFTGKVYLLTSATNSSSAFFMADILQQGRAARLIGEPTGGTRQGINGGQFFFLTLPESGIEVDIPLVYQAPLQRRPDEGVQPDVVVRTQQQDVANGTDAQLRYVLSHLK